MSNEIMLKTIKKRSVATRNNTIIEAKETTSNTQIEKYDSTRVIITLLISFSFFLKTLLIRELDNI
uniref:Putative ovule protein n=1 Tax=Solanum chacoense TaxID=4108 RepID=A0A0V0GRS6_SOLCH